VPASPSLRREGPGCHSVGAQLVARSDRKAATLPIDAGHPSDDHPQVAAFASERVAAFTPEWWPPSRRNPWPASPGIRSRWPESTPVAWPPGRLDGDGSGAVGGVTAGSPTSPLRFAPTRKATLVRAPRSGPSGSSTRATIFLPPGARLVSGSCRPSGTGPNVEACRLSALADGKEPQELPFERVAGGIVTLLAYDAPQFMGLPTAAPSKAGGSPSAPPRTNRHAVAA